jgi:endonuclease YncB( thermonuclease family)
MPVEPTFILLLLRFILPRLLGGFSLFGWVWKLFTLPFRILGWLFRGGRSKPKTAPIADIPGLPPSGVYRLDYVCDGDTINVSDGQIEFRVRLAAMDAPEKDQPFGKEASDFLKKWLPKGTLLWVEVVDYDAKWNRVVAYVENEEDICINLALVELGYGYWYKAFAPHAKQYKEAEKRAREMELGVWSLGNTVRPWNHRKSAA